METDRGSLRAMFLEAAEVAMLHSGGRLKVVKNEKDTTPEADPEAARFLKLDGNRLGRDLELYAFMVDMGGASLLANFVGEVIYPLKNVLPDAAKHSGERFRDGGLALVPDDMRDKWNDLFA